MVQLEILVSSDMVCGVLCARSVSWSNTVLQVRASKLSYTVVFATSALTAPRMDISPVNAKDWSQLFGPQKLCSNTQKAFKERVYQSISSRT